MTCAEFFVNVVATDDRLKPYAIENVLAERFRKQKKIEQRERKKTDDARSGDVRFYEWTAWGVAAVHVRCASVFRVFVFRVRGRREICIHCVVVYIVSENVRRHALNDLSDQNDKP